MNDAFDDASTGRDDRTSSDRRRLVVATRHHECDDRQEDQAEQSLAGSRQRHSFVATATPQATVDAVFAFCKLWEKSDHRLFSIIAASSSGR